MAEGKIFLCVCSGLRARAAACHCHLSTSTCRWLGRSSRLACRQESEAELWGIGSPAQGTSICRPSFVPRGRRCAAVTMGGGGSVRGRTQTLLCMAACIISPLSGWLPSQWASAFASASRALQAAVPALVSGLLPMLPTLACAKSGGMSQAGPVHSFEWEYKRTGEHMRAWPCSCRTRSPRPGRLCPGCALPALFGRVQRSCTGFSTALKGAGQRRFSRMLAGIMHLPSLVCAAPRHDVRAGAGGGRCCPLAPAAARAPGVALTRARTIS